MNRLKSLIAPDSQQHQVHQQQQQLFDKKLSHRIKRFSSERNLFIAQIYSDNGPHGQTPAPLPHHASQMSLAEVPMRAPVAADKPPMSKLEKTKSFCRSGLKKCKSLKELYQQRASVTNAPPPPPSGGNAAKSFQQMDEFERNYLFSAGKGGLVRELRKNFEKKSPAEPTTPFASKATYRKCDYSEITDADVPPQVATAAERVTTGKKKRPLNACHSFSVTTNTMMAQQVQQQQHQQHHNASLCNSEPPSWTQSAMNLSTLVTTTSPSNTDESSDYSSSEPDKTDAPETNIRHHDDDDRCSSLLMLKNMRNSSSHQRANDGDTMSMCELSMYPVYMHNINDNNNLLATRQSDCDSGISINNTTLQPTSTKRTSEAVVSTTPAATLAAGPTGLLKKYSSVNQIDLELLKSELNDFAGTERAPAASSNCTQSTWTLWGTAPAHYHHHHHPHNGLHRGIGRPPYHHRSASSLVSAVRRKVCMHPNPFLNPHSFCTLASARLF